MIIPKYRAGETVRIITRKEWEEVYPNRTYMSSDSSFYVYEGKEAVVVRANDMGYALKFDDEPRITYWPKEYLMPVNLIPDVNVEEFNEILTGG